jgi:type IX secretion system PorP/SprF family membrane protein
MKMKKHIFILAAVAGMTSAHAQQLPLFSQYYYNQFLYNPGFAGTGDKANLYLVHRSQWKDMPGAPVTYALTVDGPVAEKMGMGISLFSDQTDMINRIGISGSYSYKIQLSGDHYLHPGLALGASDNRFDFSRANVYDANDPMLLAQTRRKVAFDANFGLAYIWNDLRVGFSVPQLFGNKVNFLNDGQDQVYLRLKQHFLTSVSYRFVLSESAEVDCTPSIMARYAAGSPFQMDINAMFSWKDMLRGGFSYRLGYAVGLTAGVKLYKNIVAGYSYDLAVNSVKAYTGGGHEILLGYTFGGGGNSSANDAKIRELEEKINAAQANDTTINNLKKVNNDQNREIEDLKKQLEELKKTGSNTDKQPDNNNTNTTNNTTETPNKDIRAENLADYTDENGQAIAQGYYVVVESFKNINNAKNNKKFYEEQKNVKVQTIYNKVRKFYYNSVLYTSDEESAVDVMMEVKKEKPDAWIFKLME